MRTGPNGERRPVSPVSAVVAALEEAASRVHDEPPMPLHASSATAGLAHQRNLPNLGGAWVEGKGFGAGDDKTAVDVLRRIRREARHEGEKGEWFEELFMRIARTAPELAVAAIHRWQTWPDRLRLTGLDGRDIGVDLVAELTDGTLAAVQRFGF